MAAKGLSRRRRARARIARLGCSSWHAKVARLAGGGVTCQGAAAGTGQYRDRSRAPIGGCTESAEAARERSGRGRIPGGGVSAALAGTAGAADCIECESWQSTAALRTARCRLLGIRVAMCSSTVRKRARVCVRVNA